MGYHALDAIRLSQRCYPISLSICWTTENGYDRKNQSFLASSFRSRSDMESFMRVVIQVERGDSIPDSWKKYYLYNPSVPGDYSDIHTAINKVVDKAKKDPSKPRSVRILLR